MEPLVLFFCGDVMTGRGIDQILPHAGEPVLYESCVRDAREYITVAERRHGPIPRPVDFNYIWGDALVELEQAKAEVRIINLETSITSSEEHWPDKGIHYRMHPRNIGCLTAARISVCALANNHVLDWGYPGLAETLHVLDQAGVAHAGAGGSAAEAAVPVVLDVAGRTRLLLFSLGSSTSGIPWEWQATNNRPGVNLLDDLSEETARRVVEQMRPYQRPGDLLVASIHWGSNWGYDIPPEERAFAHRLIDQGVFIVHGHSSHHVKAIEVYQERLVLYGCGDFLTDYEGISGYESFRGDLSLMYLVQVDSQQGRMVGVKLVPLQMRHFRLNRASARDARWLRDLLNWLGKPYGTEVKLVEDNRMNLVWA